jgi:hypothetical protein
MMIAMASCVACESAAPVSGWLCEECAAAIHGLTRLLPEQIVADVEQADAALVDRWGRTHPLAVRTLVGRQLEHNGIAITEASVSRRHAEILRKRDGTWWIVDLVSSNGTTVDDEPVHAPRRLMPRGAVFLGEIGFYFVTPPPGPPPVHPRWPTTHRPPESTTAAAPVRLYDEADEVEEHTGEPGFTFCGLRTVDLTLASPTGGGGGVVELNGKTARLTDVQYQLVRVLAERMTAEEGHDERVRGFVRSTELLATLPWDTARPEDNHIKQLVRRVRRTLVRAQIGDLIESRHGFGYRLRVRLRSPPPSE